MINITYLSHNRTNFSKLTFHYLDKIKEINKAKITINILSSHDNNWNLGKLHNIKTNVIKFNNSQNYLDKIKFAINCDSEYSIKLDEDCFINNHVWDYLIENINVLDNDENLLISPTMSNNIPSCDQFIEDFILDESIKNKIYDLFIKRVMPNGLWGVDYSPLNKCTIEAKNWNYLDFYQEVNKLNTVTKGIHPLRICYESQLLINEYIINNLSRFSKINNYELIELKAPYFTNSLFAIKTKEWKNILENKYVDSYDEIALNAYKKDNNKKFLFIKNGFGIHPMYNTVFGNKNPWNIGVENGEQLEQEFYNNLEKRLTYDTLYRR